MYKPETRGLPLKIAVCASRGDAAIIHDLLSPWKLTFTDSEEAEATIAYKMKAAGTKAMLMIPSDASEFSEHAKEVCCRAAKGNARHIRVSTGSPTSLSVTPSAIYSYGRANETENCIAVFPREDTCFLTVDVVHEYNLILRRTLNAKLSTAYRLLTGSPIPYTLAPTRLRNLLTIRKYRSQPSFAFCERLQLDALRFVLSKGLEDLTKRKISRKTWNNRNHAYVVTHDIESQKGLQNAKRLKRLEEEYDIQSAWYIPSEHYKLDPATVKDLANHGEVGAHDTKHDGKLVYLSENQLLKRLKTAKRTLSRLIGQTIDGFRAPLLQHNTQIIRALTEAGYSYDSSIPTYEPNHPCTMRPHGIETTFPLKLYGLTEVPVTLPQDHQLLNVLGLTPKEALSAWLEMMGVVKHLGGLCTLLVHPEYDLADTKSRIYEDILREISTDSQAAVVTPSKITQIYFGSDNGSDF